MKNQKVKASQNKAKDVETPQKLKYLDIPDIAKAEVARMSQNFDKYLAGVAAGLGIKSSWSFDIQKMKIVVKDK